VPIKLENVIRVALNYPPPFVYYYARSILLRQKPLADFDDKHPCLFVLSTGRSGTHTLAGLYKLAPGFLAYHEPAPDLDGLARVAYEYGKPDDAAFTKILAEAFLAARYTLLQTSLHAVKGYIEASHLNTFLAPYIYQALPAVRFVHVVRHPRDFVTSAMRRGWYRGNTFDKNRIVPRTGSDEADQWDSYEPYRKNIWLWAETNRWIMDFLGAIPDQNVLQIRAEDIFAGEMETISQLYTLIGTPVPSKGQIEKVLDKKLDSAPQRAFTPLGQWTDTMLADLDTVAGETAMKLGYSI
jgi:hypothetical protein